MQVCSHQSLLESRGFLRCKGDREGPKKTRMQNLSDAGPARTSLQRLCCIVDFRDKELAELRRLLQLGGADPNLEDTFQRSSLSLLCMHSGHYEAAETLLAAGARLSAQDAWGRE